MKHAFPFPFPFSFSLFMADALMFHWVDVWNGNHGVRNQFRNGRPYHKQADTVYSLT